MGLFSRASGAHVAVTPDIARRRQSVTATITTDKPIDKVSAATLEWGYTNFYRYRWAGRADSLATGLAIQLVRRYSSLKDVQIGHGGMAPHKLRKVQ